MGQLSCARLRFSDVTVAQSTTDVQLCMNTKVEGQRSMPSFRLSTPMMARSKILIFIIIKGLKETTHGYKKNETKRMVSQFSELQYDVSIFSNRRQSNFTKCHS